MPDFTPTQGRYLAFIKAYTDGYGLPPAESDMAKAMQVSPPSVNQMMKMLESKGLIRRQPGVGRTIEILIPSEDIPKWKGRMVPRIVRTWVFDPRAAQQMIDKRRAQQENSAGRAGHKNAASVDTVYRFKITLQDTSPPIWRRIETTNVSLNRFHAHIQTAMGWKNSHCYMFTVDGDRFTDPRLLTSGFDDMEASSDEEIRLDKLIDRDKKPFRMRYEYDFGDSWIHEIKLEETVPPEPGVRYPRCIDGAQACPPEDVGGVPGFADFVYAITHEDDPEHGDMKAWCRGFDPAKFSATTATNRMRRGLKYR